MFITDVAIEDLEAVKDYSIQLARQIAAGRRKFTKLVLIGLGPQVNEAQMEELDDLDCGGLKSPEGDDIDLWDHTLAATMRRLEEIFKEVVSAQTILAPSAKILDSFGKPVTPIGRTSYADGLPAFLKFSMQKGATAFTLQLPDGTAITQPIA